MSKSLQQHVNKLNLKIALLYLFALLLNMFNAFLYTITFSMIMSIFTVENNKYKMYFLIVLFLCLNIYFFFKNKLIKYEYYRMGLEINYPQAKESIYKYKDNLNKNWLINLKNFDENILKNKALKLSHILINTAAALLSIFILNSFSSATKAEQTIIELASSISSYEDKTSLVIIHGIDKNLQKDQKSNYKITPDKTINLILQEDNLLQINFTTSKVDKNFIIELRNNDSIIQSFQMEQDYSKTTKFSKSYTLSFEVENDAEIWLPFISNNRALIKTKISKKPIPIVRLDSIETEDGSWNDNELFPVTIKASAKNLLKNISLVLLIDKKPHNINVLNIMTEKAELETKFEINFEKYISEDATRIQLFATATDKSIPVALIGRSQIISLDVISAYGRYKRTLNTLKELKQNLDIDAVDSKHENLANSKKLSAKAVIQSEDSPYFDFIDRNQIQDFNFLTQALNKTTSSMELLQLSDKLAKFLQEHETLDDRERDRDFFVAARNFSRLLDSKQDNKQETILNVSKRIQKYLATRHKRWQQRVKYLEQKPKLWSKWQAQPLISAKLNNITKLSSNSAQQESLNTATKEYKEWITQLESAEDKEREKKAQKMKKNMQSAQKQLKELRQRQDKISKSLDKASTKSHQTLVNSWPINRMKENTNIKVTKKLVDKLKSISTTAGARLEAAHDAMQYTLNSANKENFKDAETFSDLASRLLRQANRAAQKAAKSRKKRRRRRVMGDNYYGKSITGGTVELKHQYQVEKRYREAILEEAQSKEDNDEDKLLLEKYIRAIVR